MVELLLTISASLKSGSTPCLAKVSNLSCNATQGRSGRESIPFGVYPHQPQFLPTALYDILNAQIELTAHHDGVGLPRELVEESERDRVDFVIDIQTGKGSWRSCTENPSCGWGGGGGETGQDSWAYHLIYFR